MLCLEQEYQREPTDEEIAMFLDLEHDEVKMAIEIKKKHISFDMPLASNDDNDFNLYDVVQTNNLPAPDNHSMNESLATDIQRVLRKLTPKEAEILTMSFGLCNTPVYSLHDIAVKYEMSSERIRQIKSRGLLKLKHLLRGKHVFLDF